MFAKCSVLHYLLLSLQSIMSCDRKGHAEMRKNHCVCLTFTPTFIYVVCFVVYSDPITFWISFLCWEDFWSIALSLEIDIWQILSAQFFWRVVRKAKSPTALSSTSCKPPFLLCKVLVIRVGYVISIGNIQYTSYNGKSHVYTRI